MGRRWDPGHFSNKLGTAQEPLREPARVIADIRLLSWPRFFEPTTASDYTLHCNNSRRSLSQIPQKPLVHFCWWNLVHFWWWPRPKVDKASRIVATKIFFFKWLRSCLNFDETRRKSSYNHGSKVLYSLVRGGYLAVTRCTFWPKITILALFFTLLRTFFFWLHDPRKARTEKRRVHS